MFGQNTVCGRGVVMRSARFGGSVHRWHTWPVLQPQTNADHTWNCLRIYQQTFGRIPPNTAKYLTFHDCGELGVGDLPFPVKANNPKLKRLVDAEERRCLSEMGIVLSNIEAPEKLRVRYADLMDMHEYGIVEMRMGNQYAAPIVVDTWKAINTLQERMSDKDRLAVAQYFIRTGNTENWEALLCT